MPYVRIITFGCKVNQCDSAGLAQGFATQGWQEATPDKAPDLLLVNTCTVTARADQQARQAIRRLARDHPGVPIGVTGCYAQRAPEEVAGLPGVAAVLGNQEKARSAHLLGESASPGKPMIRVAPYPRGAPFQSWPVRALAGHTRAWVKVQDGCNHQCRYCIVPRVRGRSRSLEPGQVAAALQAAGAQGFQEVVLTGVDLGQYGRDLQPGGSLAGLIGRLQGRAWPFRVRLSSLEPQEIDLALLREAEGWTNFCPHFHLPLQSGAAPVLEAMGRPYRVQQFQDLAWEIHRTFPEAALGCDILVGFPGETAGDFAATRALVESLPVTYLHVFPFSPRPGTAAAATARLPGKEIQDRARTMRDLGQRKKREFYQAQLGRVREVLVEGVAPLEGWLRGLSDNYLRVIFPGPAEWRNCRIMVRGERVLEEVMMGAVVKGPQDY